MMSTQKGDGSFRNGIPLGEIIEKLHARNCPVVRSDEVPAELAPCFEAEPQGRWIDCVLPA